MDLLSTDSWDDSFRDTLSTLRKQRFIPSNNWKVGDYVNVLRYEDSFFIEQNLNGLFSAQDLNFFTGDNPLPAMTSMDGHAHKSRKVPMKDFLTQNHVMTDIVDDFFDRMPDELDIHLDFSLDLCYEIAVQLMGFPEDDGTMIYEQLQHFVHNRIQKCMPLFELFKQMYKNPVGLTKVTAEVSNNLEEFVGNMFLMLSGIFTLSSAIELLFLEASKNDDQLIDADDRFFKETIRMWSPFSHQLRRSTDRWMGYPAGTVFANWFISSNLDPDKFEDPHTFNAQRENLNNHFGFGFGVHRCIGRQITNVVLSRLVERIKEYKWCALDYNVVYYPIVYVNDLWVQRSKR